MSLLIKFELLEIYPQVNEIIPNEEVENLRLIFSFVDQVIEENAMLMLANIETSNLKISSDSVKKELKISTKLYKGDELLGAGDFLIPGNTLDKKVEIMKKWLIISNKIGSSNCTNTNKTERRSQNLAMNLVNSIRLHLKANIKYSEVNIVNNFSMSDVESGKKTNHNSHNSFLSNNNNSIIKNNSSNMYQNFNDENETLMNNSNSILESIPSICDNNMTMISGTMKQIPNTKNKEKNKDTKLSQFSTMRAMTSNSVGPSRNTSMKKMKTKVENLNNNKNNKSVGNENKSTLKIEDKGKNKKAVSIPNSNINTPHKSTNIKSQKNFLKGKDKTKTDLKAQKTSTTNANKNKQSKVNDKTEKATKVNTSINTEKENKHICIQEPENVENILNTEGEEEEENHEEIDDISTSFIDPIFLEEDNPEGLMSNIYSNKLETSLEEFKMYYTPEFFEVLPEDSLYLKFEAKMLLEKCIEIQQNYYLELNDLLQKQNAFRYLYSQYGEKYKTMNKKLNRIKEALESIHMKTTFHTFMDRQLLLRANDTMSLANDELNFYKQVLNVSYQSKEVNDHVKKVKEVNTDDRKKLLKLAEVIFQNKTVEEKLTNGQKMLVNRMLKKKKIETESVVLKADQTSDDALAKSNTGNISFNNLNVVYTNHNMETEINNIDNPSNIVTLSNADQASDVIPLNQNNVSEPNELASYVDSKGEDVDMKLREALKEYYSGKSKNKVSFEFKQISEGLYEYGQSKVIVFVENGDVKVNNSNCVLPLTAFIETSSHKNVKQLKKEDTGRSTKSKKGTSNSIETTPPPLKKHLNVRNSFKK